MNFCFLRPARLFGDYLLNSRVVASYFVLNEGLLGDFSDDARRALNTPNVAKIRQEVKEITYRAGPSWPSEAPVPGSCRKIGFDGFYYAYYWLDLSCARGGIKHVR